MKRNIICKRVVFIFLLTLIFYIAMSVGNASWRIENWDEKGRFLVSGLWAIFSIAAIVVPQELIDNDIYN